MSSLELPTTASTMMVKKRQMVMGIQVARQQRLLQPKQHIPASFRLFASPSLLYDLLNCNFFAYYGDIAITIGTGFCNGTVMPVATGCA